MDFPEKQNEYHFRLDNFRSVVVTSDQFDANVEAYGRLNKASEIRKGFQKRQTCHRGLRKISRRQYEFLVQLRRIPWR